MLFKLFNNNDKNNSGLIDRREFQRIIETINDLFIKNEEKEEEEDEENINYSSNSNRLWNPIESVITIMDNLNKNLNEKLNEYEFINGILNDQHLSHLLLS
jgi:hypothetical protein